MKSTVLLLGLSLTFLATNPCALAQKGQAIAPRLSGSQTPNHVAAKDDIEAIGTREIGSKGLGNWYVVTTSEFEDVKSHLMNNTLQNHDQELDRPTLRHRDSPNGSSAGQEPTMRTKVPDGLTRRAIRRQYCGVTMQTRVTKAMLSELSRTGLRMTDPAPWIGSDDSHFEDDGGGM